MTVLARTGIRLLLCVAATSAYTTNVLASDEEKKASKYEHLYLDAELSLELGNDWLFYSTDPANELNDLYVNGELALKIGLTRHLSINGGLTLEPVEDARPALDRYFGDIGLYVDTLNLQIDVGNASLYAGKLGSMFGTAWDVAPGIYGADFAEDYELAEMIGFRGTYQFNTTNMGQIILGANLYYPDTSFLSDSMFTSRGPFQLEDGGAGNTEKLNNFLISLDGSEIVGMDGLSWHMSYRYLSPGVDSSQGEHGFVAGLLQTVELANGMSLTTNSEIAYLDGNGGSEDDAFYAVGGIALQNGPWHGELAGSFRHFRLDGGDTAQDYLLQASGGYEFENGLDISLGYGYARVEDTDNHIVGVRLTKDFAFSTR